MKESIPNPSACQEESVLPEKVNEGLAMDRMCAFFDLLLRIDRRNKPELYGNKSEFIADPAS